MLHFRVLGASLLSLSASFSKFGWFVVQSVFETTMSIEIDVFLKEKFSHDKNEPLYL